MMQLFKKRAFTLIEMLSVVIIIGIILTIAIPVVSNITNNRSKKLYRTHMTVIEKATDLYVDQNKSQLINSTSDCFELDYQTLISDNMVKEGEISCDGSIILRKTVGNNAYQKEYFLTCVDDKGNEVSNSGTVPAGCLGFNAKFKVDYKLYLDSDKNLDYDGNSFVKNAYIVLNSVSPYGADIDSFEYTIPTDTNWTKISSGSNLGSINNLKNYSGNIYVRAVDTNDNKSDSASIRVKLDNAGPEFNSSLEGTIESKTITISDVVDKGIGKLASSAYSYDGGNTWTNNNTLTIVRNGNMNICCKDSLENTTCKDVSINGIDSQQPTIVAKQAKTYIISGQSKAVTDYFTISYGSKGGTVECTVNNINELPLGINTVTCTAKGTTNLTATATTTFAHQYTATGMCSSGTLVNNSSCYFASNASVCGTSCNYGCDSTWNSCKTGSPNQCVAGYTSECKTYSCTLYSSCTICTCRNTSTGASYLSGPNPNQSSFSNSCVSAYGAHSATWSCSSGRQSGCGTETVTGSACNNASSKYCSEYVYSSCASTTNTCQGGYVDTNCSSCKTTSANSCNKTDSSYLSYSCPTTGKNGSTGQTIAPTLSGSTCSF